MCYIWCDDGVVYGMSGVYMVWYVSCIDGVIYGMAGVMTVWCIVCLLYIWCGIWYGAYMVWSMVCVAIVDESN